MVWQPQAVVVPNIGSGLRVSGMLMWRPRILGVTGCDIIGCYERTSKDEKARCPSEPYLVSFYSNADSSIPRLNLSIIVYIVFSS